MKLVVSALLLLIAPSATTPAKPALRAPVVAAGRFQTWSRGDKHKEFVSGGIHIAIKSAPCDAQHASEGCRYDGSNNQALVTISAPGKPPFVVETDNQAEYYRIAVVRLDRRDPRPGVIIENDSGGSGGDVVEYVIRPEGGGFRRLLLDKQRLYSGYHLEGEIADFPHDLSGDGVVDLALGDGRFAFVFGCNACTPRPPLIFTIRDGRAVEVSREPAFASIFRKDMAGNAATCRSQDSDRNGACAAYAADAARLGEFGPAMKNVTRWYERNDQWLHGEPFPTQLRAFLRKSGYIH